MVVVPGDPFQRCKLDGFPCFPRRSSVNQFRFVQTVDCFRQGVVVAVAATADRWLYARFGKPLGVPNGNVLRSPDALLKVKG
ncbi:hypothetical protein B7759_05847 (plasmid) [Burkholderia glumae]|nr:hypothetical protein B7759_05847 [Burkholderia glumae]